MITCHINGKQQELQETHTVEHLLRDMNLFGKKVAVEKNGVIVSKSRHGEETIKDGDTVEIVTAVGGG